MPETKENYDEGEHIKETFACFGRAAYMANVVETGLAQTLLQIEFMAGVRDEFIRTKGKDFDREKCAADFDAYLEEKFEKTMGTLKRLAFETDAFNENLKRRITEATDRRNFLIHHYWRKADVLFLDKDGRAKMIEELERDIQTFEKLDQDIRDATKPVRKKLGIKEEELDARVEQRMLDARNGIEVE
jgi:hypothetical protein